MTHWPAGTTSARASCTRLLAQGHAHAGARLAESKPLAESRLVKGSDAASVWQAWGPCGSVGTLLKRFLADEAPPAGAVEVLVCVSEGNALLEKQFAKTSVPHFLFYRNGLLRQTVAGADVPTLQKALKAHLPREGDPTDDPAVRPPLPSFPPFPSLTHRLRALTPLCPPCAAEPVRAQARGAAASGHSGRSAAHGRPPQGWSRAERGGGAQRPCGPAARRSQRRRSTLAERVRASHRC